MRGKVAIAGAGIYGATTALRLAEHGYDVHLFDPLGILRAASAINQCRVHAGYHYPRSGETIAEVMEARAAFLEEFAPVIVKNTRHYYAIPRRGSRTSIDVYETVMARHGLPLEPCHPAWLDFSYIEACYEVQEHLYDPDILRSLLETRVKSHGIRFEQSLFSSKMRGEYDYVVWATYGMGPSRGLFKSAKYQIAEKILVQLPAALRGLAVVLVDGPFTGFDAYGNSEFALFGSAKHTNHWSTTDPGEPVPERYASILNAPRFEQTAFTRFAEMGADCCLAIPAAKEARYIGSRFTMRVVEDNPGEDRRTLYVKQSGPGEFHVFSGKVVSAVKASRLLCEAIGNAG